MQADLHVQTLAGAYLVCIALREQRGSGGDVSDVM